MKKRGGPARWRRWFLLLLVIYLAQGLLLFAFQRKLYYRHGGGEPTVRDWKPPFDAEVVEFASTDGTELVCLYTKPPDPKKPVILLAHGNAGSIRSWGGLMVEYQRRGFGGLLLDPRGYGASAGSPDEDGVIADGEAALGYLRRRGYESADCVLHGVSLGGGIVSQLAAEHPVRGLILQSTFTSLVDVAQGHAFWMPCDLVLLDRFESLAAMPRVRAPVLVVHGEADSRIPIAHGRRLASAARSGRFVPIPNGGHNSLHADGNYWAAIVEFLSGL